MPVMGRVVEELSPHSQQLQKNCRSFFYRGSRSFERLFKLLFRSMLMSPVLGLGVSIRLFAISIAAPRRKSLARNTHCRTDKNGGIYDAAFFSFSAPVYRSEGRERLSATIIN
jgi:hypothetical protein